MTDRYLGIGIDNYPGAALRGCVHDIEDSLSTVMDIAGFVWGNCRTLTDRQTVSYRRAHAMGIKRRIRQFITGLKKDDRALLCYSGHGAQVPQRNGATGEVDQIDEVLCPVDFDPDDRETWIDDDWFTQTFAGVPSGVNCLVVLDSCFSGGMIDQPRTNVSMDTLTVEYDQNPRAYPIEASLDFGLQLEAAKAKGIKPKRFIKAEKMPNVAFIFGCQEDQTSAEAMIGDRYRGALSYYLYQTIREERESSLSISNIVKIVRDKLDDAKYSQIPTIIGPSDILSALYMEKL